VNSMMVDFRDGGTEHVGPRLRVHAVHAGIPDAAATSTPGHRHRPVHGAPDPRRSCCIAPGVSGVARTHRQAAPAEAPRRTETTAASVAAPHSTSNTLNDPLGKDFPRCVPPTDEHAHRVARSGSGEHRRARCCRRPACDRAHRLTCDPKALPRLAAGTLPRWRMLSAHRRLTTGRCRSIGSPPSTGVPGDIRSCDRWRSGFGPLDSVGWARSQRVNEDGCHLTVVAAC
jgi:hypothetical protein